jgi:hypothetical protein
MSQAAIIGVVVLMMMSSSVGAVALMMGGEDDKKTGPSSTGPSTPSTPTTPAPIGLYSKSDGIRHQVNNPDGEHLFYYRLATTPWNKYYKFSCKTPSGAESAKLGPYGPVTMGNYHGPKLRIGPAGTKPCGETNKMHIYRSDSETGNYLDVTTNMRNFPDTSAYGGQEMAFVDTYGMGEETRN